MKPLVHEIELDLWFLSVVLALVAAFIFGWLPRWLAARQSQRHYRARRIRAK